MKLIVITQEEASDKEIGQVKQLLASGLVWRVHIRKKQLSDTEMLGFLGAFSESEKRLLSSHSHYDLALEEGLGGLHFTSKMNTEMCQELYKQARAQGMLTSASCHSFNEVERSSSLDYVFLSPIFSSISKILEKAFSYNAIRLFLKEARIDVFALGGISLETIEFARELGFPGVASLGYIWLGDNPCEQARSLLGSESTHAALCS